MLTNVAPRSQLDVQFQLKEKNEMKSGILYLVILLITVKDNSYFFSDAMPIETRRKACGKGQFDCSNSNTCMTCKFACKICEDLCRRHDCLGLKQIQSVATNSLLLRTRFARESRPQTKVPPKVQVKSSKKTVIENESVQLECVTSGGIHEYIRRYHWLWTKKGSIGEHLIQDSKTITTNGKFLEFEHIQYSKSGRYTCRAWNAAGMGQGSIDLDVKLVPKTSVIGVSRTDNKVTISWKPVIGKYAAITVKYCQRATEFCKHYIVPNPEDTSATFFVDPDKTYDHFCMIVKDGSGADYTSNCMVAKYSNAKTDTVAVTVGGSATGAVIVTATCFILAVALWKHRQSKKALKNQVANDTNDDDATRIPLAAIENCPKHTYANIGTARLNYASSHSARTAMKYPTKPRAKMYIPAEDRVSFGNDPAYSDDDVDIDQYDYADTKWLRDASGFGSSNAASQASQATWEQDVSAQIHVPGDHQGNQSDLASTSSSCQDMQNFDMHASIERQREPEPNGTGNDVNIIITQRRHQSRSDGGLDQAKSQHNASCQNRVSAHQSDADDPMDVFSNEDMSGQNVSQDSSYDDVRIVTQGEPAHSTTKGCLDQETWQHKDMHELRPYVLCEKQMGQEPGTYNDVRIITHGQPGLAVCGPGKARLAKILTPGRSSDCVASGKLSHYEHLEPGPLEPVSRNEYIDLMGLSPKQLNLQM